jgi:hypothetical protein
MRIQHCTRETGWALPLKATLVYVKVEPLAFKADSQARRLWDAARCGDIRAVVELLKGPERPHIDTPDERGWTAVLWAAWGGHKEVLEVLGQRGADLYAQSKDDVTPLGAAAGRGHRGVVELLLARGANVKAKDEDGNTALMAAARGGHEEVVKLLLANGANAFTRNKAYRMAEELTTVKSIKALLKKARGDVSLPSRTCWLTGLSLPSSPSPTSRSRGTRGRSSCGSCFGRLGGVRWTTRGHF